MTGARRIDQDMARAAVALLPATVTPEMRTRYRQLRAMLHSAGLAATYAFVAAKAGEGNDLAEAYRKVRDGISGRLADLGLLARGTAGPTVSDVLDRLGGMDAVEYARASAEVAALAGWLSRLADAVCGAAGSAVGADGGQSDGEGKER